MHGANAALLLNQGEAKGAPRTGTRAPQATACVVRKPCSNKSCAAVSEFHEDLPPWAYPPGLPCVTPHDSQSRRLFRAPGRPRLIQHEIRIFGSLLTLAERTWLRVRAAWRARVWPA
jgi:hypothetical protein